MRILYITGHYPPDLTSGATMQIRRTAEHVSTMGHEVTVLAGALFGGLADGATRTEEIGGVTVRWIGTADRADQDIDGNWQNPAAGREAADLLAQWQPDVVHAHVLQTLGGDPVAAAVAADVPVVLTMHDFWWWCPRLFLVDRDLHPCPLDTTRSNCACARTAAWRHDRAGRLRTILDAVDQVLVPSAVVRDAVITNGLAHERVDVDENDFPGGAPAAGVAPPSSTGEVRFAYAGGDHAVKGRDVVLAAAARLSRRRGWLLRAYGVPPPPLRRWRRRRGRVDYLPAYRPEDTDDVFGQADVLLLASIARESYSMLAREALGCGVAVVSSDCLGPTEVVDHGINGLIVPTGDDRALAEAMEALVNDRALLDRLRRGARSAAPRRRDPVEHAASLVERYRALVTATT